ncbi:hypothetical protein [Dactylosporangium sp. CA-092794]|uniref:hypothetical protein n=1 Tax=Dactylosporangium sp. CA-092794 TaxID=3239929 RepID=UPI003D9142CE
MRHAGAVAAGGGRDDLGPQLLGGRAGAAGAAEREPVGDEAGPLHAELEAGERIVGGGDVRPQFRDVVDEGERQCLPLFRFYRYPHCAARAGGRVRRFAGRPDLVPQPQQTLAGVVGQLQVQQQGTVAAEGLRQHVERQCRVGDAGIGHRIPGRPAVPQPALSLGGQPQRLAAAVAR